MSSHRSAFNTQRLFPARGWIHVLGALVIVTGSIPGQLAANPNPERGGDPSSYQAILAEKESYYSRSTAYEIIASGAAATIIGFYGYDFDQRGFVAKIAYAATQTAGIIGVGEGIRRLYGGSLETDLERALSKYDHLDRSQIRELILSREQRQKYADQVATTWTASLLATTYLYNAYREPKKNNTTRSVYLFLAANALAVAGYTGYGASADHHPVSSSFRTMIGLGAITVVYEHK